MKKKLILIISLITVLCCPETFAQTLEADVKQSLTIPGPGFFPFSTISNNKLQELFPSNPNLSVVFSNFLGSTCAIAPAADFAEIGPQTIIRGNGTFNIDFSGASPTAGTFGLSFVPQNAGTCIFDLFITSPEITTTSSSSSSSGSVISDGPFITPDGVSIIGGYIDDLTSTISNEQNNQECMSDPSGIDSIKVNDTFINQLYNSLLNRAESRITLSEKFKVITSSQEENSFTLELPENKNNTNAVLNQKLVNTTDMTRIYVTAFLPSVSENNSIMLGASAAKAFNPDIEVTLKEQDLVALAAVQHALVSATMPWQLSQNGGFFITQGGGCVGPYCTIVESGMVVIVPGGACTPEKLNKRKAGYPTVNPSKLFDPFPASAMTIQIPTANIVDPKHPLVSMVLQDNAYLIFQPVPPKAKFTQQIKLNLMASN